jgi:hypothetical protein
VFLPEVDSSANKLTASTGSVNNASAGSQDLLAPSALSDGRKRDKIFESDLPKYASIDDTPKTICWRDIEPFYIRNPEGGRDVFCAIINFTNLKGRPEGADG